MVRTYADSQPPGDGDPAGDQHQVDERRAAQVEAHARDHQETDRQDAVEHGADGVARSHRVICALALVLMIIVAAITLISALLQRISRHAS